MTRKRAILAAVAAILLVIVSIIGVRTMAFSRRADPPSYHL